ncbi:hypothetical protein [Nocardia otitidiscaviarum]|nr:hypothetical protein [Nocardia otitidiscaviarum]
MIDGAQRVSADPGTEARSEKPPGRRNVAIGVGGVTAHADRADQYV